MPEVFNSSDDFESWFGQSATLIALAAQDDGDGDGDCDGGGDSCKGVLSQEEVVLVSSRLH